MLKKLVVAGLVLAAAGSSWAQDFEGLNQSTAVAPAAANVAAITPPPAQATGQGAPYYGYGGYQYGNWNSGYYNQYNQLQQRYNRVIAAIESIRNQYGYLSGGRSQFDSAESQGRQYWYGYARYQDQQAAWQLDLWLSQWEQYLASYGWNQPYTYSSYTGGSWTSNQPTYYYQQPTYYQQPSYYQLPNYGYYDNYSSWYYGRNNYYYPDQAYVNGFQVGNGIGNIVNGSRYDNGLQLTGGILSTIGGVLNIANGARY